jgi:site-specific DNA-cytosine methylase
MATDFASVMAAGDGPGTFIEAAKGARVAFASPPCSQTSVVNKAGDESSYTARLSVYTLNILRYLSLEVLIVESTPTIVSALGGRLLTEMFALLAALPMPYVLHVLHIDPTLINGVQTRARVLLAMVRKDVFDVKGAFMPPLSYEVKGAAPLLRSILDDQNDESACRTDFESWEPTGKIHDEHYTGARLDFTREVDGKVQRCYSIDGACPTVTSDDLWVADYGRAHVHPPTAYIRAR